MKFNLSILCILYASLSLAQTSSMHSHNDYQQKVPFWDAYSHGAKSIEADIFLKDQKLFVAHEEYEIEPNKTFEQLYLYPIIQVYEYRVSEPRKLQLLVDIKSEANATLNAFIILLKPYQKNLYPYNPQGVKIVISGNRPAYQDYDQYPGFIFFDWQDTTIPQDLSKIALISLDFNEISQWNGKGKVVQKEETALKEIIAKAKRRQLPIRFWNNPDTKSAWFTFQDLGIDFIGTDHPAEAQAYFNNLEKNSVEVSCNPNSYQLTYASDNSNSKVKNVILIIGDGMGLAQISSATNFCPEMMLNQFKSIGFSKTNSANDYTTDSAAAGTAMAIGEKTNNRAIGVGTENAPKPNLVEILSKQGLKTAIITTDEITGATPAAFYAHVPDRDMKDQITVDLIDSDLDFWMGGDRKYFIENNLISQLADQGFSIADTIQELDPTVKRIAFLAGENSLPYIREGRGNLLAETTDFALNFMQESPFFMMIEGAQIDNYGHLNDIQGVVEEVIDLDSAIQKAIAFADKDGETLVIVTADHECGGLTLPHGKLNNNQIEGDFATHDHTGIMVPVFAYGPRSSEFQGVYHNNQIFHKIIKVLNIKK